MPDHSDLIATANALDAHGLLRLAASQFPGRIICAHSLGLEDMVILDLIHRLDLAIPAFTLDTGRLFNESHDLLDAIRRRYGANAVQVIVPDAAAIEDLVNTHGVNCFRESVALRRACCHVRKVQPLRRALAGKDAWICGLRRDQSTDRATVAPLAWDDANGLIKINPLHDWDDTRVHEYVRHHRIPVNSLHERGFPSIGCACCTRAVAPGEPARAGRWWWENPKHNECGLHRPPLTNSGN